MWHHLSALYFFVSGYLFYLFIVVKNNAVQYGSKCKVVLFNFGHSSAIDTDRPLCQ